jgi:hypothetical protein
VKRVIVIGVAVAAVASGCGAGGGTKIYTKAASLACLQKEKGVTVKPAPAADFVANSATGGAFSVKLRDNRATVSFGETLTDGNNIDDAYRRFHARNVGINDVLLMEQNAVILWHVHPSDADISTITNCLKG